jgi:hypothetical protein
MHSRALTVVIASVALLTGVLLGQHDAGGSRVSAQEPPAIYFGFVFTARQATGVGAEDIAPTRVRALIGENVCGTAQITPTPEPGLGFYTIEVASAADKAGCGSDGTEVKFHAFSGELDTDLPVAHALWSPGLHRLDLDAAGTVDEGAFVGDLPRGAGGAQLRWAGGSGVPIEDAVATVDREVEAVFHWDAQQQGWEFYFTGAPASTATYTVVDADDIVFVKVK